MTKRDKFKERKEAREAAMRLLYGIDYHRDDMQYHIDSLMEDENIESLSYKGKEFILSVVKGTADRLPEIDPFIEKHSKGWSFNRIPGVDIAILRLCIYEMFYREDIPVSVSINEAVNMAKKYGHDESGTFVNGILGSIYREAVKEGILKEDK